MKNMPKLCGVALSFALLLSGCAASAGTNPPGAGSAGSSAALAPNAPPKIDGIAGQFSGTVNDSALKKGKVTFAISQIVGGNAGGSMQLTFGKIVASSAVALDASSVNDITGNAVARITGQPPCTLTVKGKYDPKTLMLTGSYKAFNNCLAGQKGTFAAKQQCYYVVAKPIAAQTMPRTIPKTC
jgi:hypothetical protein